MAAVRNPSKGEPLLQKKNPNPLATISGTQMYLSRTLSSKKRSTPISTMPRGNYTHKWLIMQGAIS
jgi:hypothetical protein